MNGCFFVRVHICVCIGLYMRAAMDPEGKQASTRKSVQFHARPLDGKSRREQNKNKSFAVFQVISKFTMTKKHHIIILCNCYISLYLCMFACIKIIVAEMNKCDSCYLFQ